MMATISIAWASQVMAAPVTLQTSEWMCSQVTTIEFERLCLRSHPCQHSCVITFQNGESIETSLWGDEAHLIIQAIGSDKCTFKNDSSITPEEHFLIYSAVYSS